jgi:two-component system LytT family sensor kinase
MLLQPLIENSIKHGLEPRISGGTVILRSRLEGDRLVIEVEDDGVGVEPGRSVTEPVSGLVREGSGIGLRNVRERLQVLYGEDAGVEMVSRPGRGTRVRLSVPVTDGSQRISSPGAATTAHEREENRRVRAASAR